MPHLTDKRPVVVPKAYIQIMWRFYGCFGGMAMVSGEVSCDLCLKEALKGTERARIYSSTWTGAGISYYWPPHVGACLLA